MAARPINFRPIPRSPAGVQFPDFTVNRSFDPTQRDAFLQGSLRLASRLAIMSGDPAPSFRRHSRRVLSLDPLKGVIHYPKEQRLEKWNDFLAEWKRVMTMIYGVGRKLLGTTVYHYPHVNPIPQYPELDRDAKAVLIALGGSGLVTTTGQNFMRFANPLRRHGIGVVSIEYPFHGRGPRNPEYMRLSAVLKMLFAMIKHYRKTGLPILLAGHSMGPTFIHALLAGSPRLVAGAIMFSPCGAMTPPLYAHYKTQLESGALDEVMGRKLKVSEESERWEEAMDRQILRLGIQRVDSEIPVWMIAGENDLWSTLDLLIDLEKRYGNAILRTVAGAGHHFFNEEVPGGGSLMVDMMLDLAQEATGIDFSPREESKIDPRSKVRSFHYNSRLFRSWVEEAHYGIPLEVFLRTPEIAQELIDRFEHWLDGALAYLG